MHCLTYFGAQFLTFACVCCLQVYLVSLPRLAQLLVVIFCFLLCFGILGYILLATETCFVVIVKVFVDFVARVSACLFSLQNRSVHQFIFARFVFFCAFFTIVCACAFHTFICKHFATLDLHKLCLLPSLFGFFARPKLA